MLFLILFYVFFFFFSSRRRHTRSLCDWSSDVCSSDLGRTALPRANGPSCTEGRCVLVDLNRATNGIYVQSIVFHFHNWLPIKLRRIRSEERRVGKECRSRWSA